MINHDNNFTSQSTSNYFMQGYRLKNCNVAKETKIIKPKKRLKCNSLFEMSKQYINIYL